MTFYPNAKARAVFEPRVEFTDDVGEVIPELTIRLTGTRWTLTPDGFVTRDLFSPESVSHQTIKGANIVINGVTRAMALEMDGSVGSSIHLSELVVRMSEP